MSILKKLFGRGDHKTLQIVEKEAKEIAQGNHAPIYPVLKPNDWVGLKADAFCQPLVRNGDDVLLWIAYARNAPENFHFITQAHLSDPALDNVVDDAMANLEAFEVEVKEMVPGKVVIIDGADFCAEKILDKKFMQAMHDRLGNKELLVSIPRRRGMMITSEREDPDIVNKFLQVHRNTWNDDSYGNAPILNALFIVEDGSIKGLAKA